MSERLNQKLAELQQTKTKGLIPFITAGDPDTDRSFSLLEALPEAGADLIELGMPFSDPAADGVVIQHASQRALASGASVVSTLQMVRRFRQNNHHTPLILMGYYNPIYRYGVQNFCVDAQQAGADGLLIVDLPFEFEHELGGANNLTTIRMIAPTSSTSRREAITANAKGFLYYVALKGVTGAALSEQANTNQTIAELKKTTAVPIAAGFGIKSPEDARHLQADLIVVGSAIIQAWQQHGLTDALTLLRSIKTALG